MLLRPNPKYKPSDEEIDKGIKEDFPKKDPSWYEKEGEKAPNKEADKPKPRK